MQLKKFVISNIVISFLILTCSYFISRYYDNFVNVNTVKFKLYDSLKNKSVNIVNVGSSHTLHGIEYNQDNCINLALPSQSYYYDLKLLERYRAKIKSDAILIIPISIFSYYASNENSEINYISLLPYKNLKNTDRLDYLLIKYLSGVMPFSNILKSIKYFIQYGFIKHITEYPKDLPLEKRQIESDKTVLGHITRKKDLGNKLIREGETNLIQILRLAQENNWKIVFITTPFSRMYLDGLEKLEENVFEKRIYNNLEETKKQFGINFAYLDYSRDNRFIDRTDLFLDDDHLNEKGAKIFTKILLDDISKIDFENIYKK